jgi:hypothetical protein
MTTRMLSIPYSEDLLLSLKKSPGEFEEEARMLLAVAGESEVLTGGHHVNANWHDGYSTQGKRTGPPLSHCAT